MILHLSLFLQIAREKLRQVVAVVLLFSSSACAAERPALVTQSEGSWQHRYEVESGRVPESALAPQRRPTPILQTQALQPEPETPASTREQLLRVVSDVLAFPFRGVGWVIQKIL